MQHWVVFYLRVKEHRKISTKDLRKVFSSRHKFWGGKSSQQTRPTFAWFLRWSALLLRRRRRRRRKWRRGHTSESTPTTLTEGMRCFTAHYTSSRARCTALHQTSSPETCRSQASRNAAQDASSRENYWNLKEGRPSVRSACSFSPQGLQASILMPRHTRSHTHPSCTVSMMDRADVWVCSNREKNNAGLIFTEVSVISVSTKQMSLTLERGKTPLHNQSLSSYNTS